MNREYLVNVALEIVRVACKGAGCENTYFEVLGYLEKLEEKEVDVEAVKAELGLKIDDLRDTIDSARCTLTYSR